MADGWVCPLYTIVPFRKRYWIFSRYASLKSMRKLWGIQIISTICHSRAETKLASYSSRKERNCWWARITKMFLVLWIPIYWNQWGMFSNTFSWCPSPEKPGCSKKTFPAMQFALDTSSLILQGLCKSNIWKQKSKTLLLQFLFFSVVSSQISLSHIAKCISVTWIAMILLWLPHSWHQLSQKRGAASTVDLLVLKIFTRDGILNTIFYAHITCHWKVLLSHIHWVWSYFCCGI